MNKWLNEYQPKIVDTLKNYNTQQFTRDLIAGLIVGIVALPLAIAFGIASGVAPEKGLYTAVIAGFIISALGGSRVQIGGPTGAFIVIVYGIVQQYGINGLIIATFMAGIILILMGLARMGSVIKFIPYPLITGFTSGIAVIIFSSQIKDFFGLHMGEVPADFIAKWQAYGENFQSTNFYALILAFVTVLIILMWPKVTRKIPGSLVAIVCTTALAQLLHFPVETIGSKFGEISSAIPSPTIPDINFTTIQNLLQPAFTIALLGGIESLLSAVVADGMIGGKHRSNMELVAQGTANIFSAVFGGIPATGAIARTATNVKNGGRTPIAGIVHAFTLLLIILFVGKWAALIPMATLAGILVVVAYNMSEWENFLSVSKGPKGDVAVLLITFFLTVLIDLTVAIEIGMLLAVFLFMRNMIKLSDVSILKKSLENEVNTTPSENLENLNVSSEIEIFEINGPLFFGAVHKFKDAIKLIDKTPKMLIIRMKNVTIIDATGIKTLRDIHNDSQKEGTKIILCEIQSDQVMNELRSSRLLFAIGKANVTTTLSRALERANKLLL